MIISVHIILKAIHHLYKRFKNINKTNEVMVFRGSVDIEDICKIEIYFTSDHRKQYFHEWRSLE